MAISIESRIFGKARGLPVPVQMNTRPNQWAQDNTSNTAGVKRPFEKVNADISSNFQQHSESQPSPSKRERLEAPLLPQLITPIYGKSLLSSLPNELFFNIVKELDDPVDLACLASTCQQAHTTVRQNHPDKLQLNKYQKARYALREELTSSDTNKSSKDYKMWHKAHSVLDFELPYSDLVISWCDAWRFTQHQMSEFDIIPRKIIQHMRLDGAEEKLRWDEDWDAQLASNGHIILHCTRTYPDVRYKSGNFQVNGAPRDDGLFQICNHIRGPGQGGMPPEDTVRSLLSSTHRFEGDCGECNTSFGMRDVYRNIAPSLAVRDVVVTTFHDLGRFEIEDCDNKEWLQCLGRLHTDNTGQSSVRKWPCAMQHYSKCAKHAWEVAVKEAFLEQQRRDIKDDDDYEDVAAEESDEDDLEPRKEIMKVFV